VPNRIQTVWKISRTALDVVVPFGTIRIDRWYSAGKNHHAGEKDVARMAKSKGNAGGYVPLATQLRNLIDNRDKGQSLNALAVACGVAHPILQRFVSGTRESLRLESADGLCRFFNVELRPRRKIKK
jgi:hypothetical protein